MNYETLGDITLKNVLNQAERNLFKKLNCVKIGTIKTFHADTQSADIEIDSLPILYGVPVHFPCGANFSIQIPVETGDDCFVLFCDTDLDNWIQNGDKTPAFAADLHGISGAICLVGLKNLATKINDYSTSGIRVRYKGVDFEVSENGVHTNSNLIVDGNISAAHIEAGDGFSGSFTDSGTGASGKTMTIEKGIITKVV